MSTVIRLSDVNGPKGGNEKCCLLKMTIAGMPDTIIESKANDLYAAIDQAFNRASRTLCRRLSKRRNRMRTTTIKQASMTHLHSGE